MEEQDIRFKTLEGIGKFMAIVGWIIVAISVIAALVMASSKSGFGGSMVLGGLVIGVLGSVQGLLIVGIGQLIQCVVAIEWNTRRVANKAELGMFPKQTV